MLEMVDEGVSEFMSIEAGASGPRWNLVEWFVFWTAVA